MRDRFVVMTPGSTTILQEMTPRGLAEAFMENGVCQITTPFRHEAIIMHTRSVARVRARMEYEINQGESRG